MHVGTPGPGIVELPAKYKFENSRLLFGIRNPFACIKFNEKLKIIFSQRLNSLPHLAGE
jgi:hypothetical protein